MHGISGKWRPLFVLSYCGRWTKRSLNQQKDYKSVRKCKCRRLAFCFVEDGDIVEDSNNSLNSVKRKIVFFVLEKRPCLGFCKTNNKNKIVNINLSRSDQIREASSSKRSFAIECRKGICCECVVMWPRPPGRGVERQRKCENWVGQADTWTGLGVQASQKPGESIFVNFHGVCSVV